MKGEDILTAARACLGTPFRHQGRLPGIGLDCAGVAIVVAKTLGYEPHDIEGYGRTPANGLFEEMLEAQPFLVRLEDPLQRQSGDLLLLRFLGEPQHVAIFAGETMIHSYEAAEVCCEHRLDERWQSRIVAVYRFAEVTA